MIHNVTAHVGPAPITIETGKLAKLADGAVTVRCGETIVFVSAVSATTIKEGQDWFPLTVDYREKAAAVGKFPGGYFKREGRPSEKEILTCRMTDRPLRPLFPKGYLYDTQIIGVLLSADGENDPDILFINGASAALVVSDIPFAGPVGRRARRPRSMASSSPIPTHSQRAVQRSRPRLRRHGERRDHDRRRGRPAPRRGVHQGARNSPTSQAATRSSPRRRNSRPRSAKPSASCRSSSSTTSSSKSPTPSPATASKPRSTQRAKSPARRPSSALKDEVSAAILAKYPEGHEVRDQPGVRLPAEESLPRHHPRQGDPLRRPRRSTRSATLSAEVGLLPALRTAARSSSAAKRRRSPSPPSRPTDEAQDLDGYTGGETTKRFILHYNFPPFSRRRNRPHRLPGPPRNRPRRARRALASLRSSRPCDDFPYAIRVSQRNHGIQRLHLDGLASAPASSRSWTPACRSRRPSPASPRPRHRVRRRRHAQALHHAHRHHRQRRSLRRHGLQALRHRRRASPASSSTSSSPASPCKLMERSHLPAPATPACKVLDVMDSALAAPAHRAQQVRPAHRDDQDQPRQDRPAHRARRQDHQRHRRRDRLRDQHRGRRHACTSTRTTPRAWPAPSRSSTA